MSSIERKGACVLHVCTSCRAAGTPREPFYQRAGYKLFHALKEELSGTKLGELVDLQPAECLSICPRPCGIAVSSAGSWSYLFGDQESTASVKEIIECLSLYLESEKGFMPRDQRPQGMRRSILGRVPPSGDPYASI